MTYLRQVEIDVVRSLQQALQCPVIRGSQTAPQPPYPFVSYTIPTYALENQGTWGAVGQGDYVKQFSQVWSVTACAQADDQALALAHRAFTWFDLQAASRLEHVSIVRVGGIVNRDNLLTLQYEYRKGFDVTLSLLHREADVADEVIKFVNHQME